MIGIRPAGVAPKRSEPPVVSFPRQSPIAPGSGIFSHVAKKIMRLSAIYGV
jgi:hypothetical protein